MLAHSQLPIGVAAHAIDLARRLDHERCVVLAATDLSYQNVEAAYLWYGVCGLIESDAQLAIVIIYSFSHVFLLPHTYISVNLPSPS